MNKLSNHAKQFYSVIQDTFAFYHIFQGIQKKIVPCFQKNVKKYDKNCDHLVTLWLQNGFFSFSFGKFMLE